MLTHRLHHLALACIYRGAGSAEKSGDRDKRGQQNQTCEVTCLKWVAKIIYTWNIFLERINFVERSLILPGSFDHPHYFLPDRAIAALVYIFS